MENYGHVYTYDAIHGAFSSVFGSLVQTCGEFLSDTRSFLSCYRHPGPTAELCRGDGTVKVHAAVLLYRRCEAIEDPVASFGPDIV